MVIAPSELYLLDIDYIHPSEINYLEHQSE